MRTDDLIATLAAGASPVDPLRADRRFVLKLAAGATAAVIASFLLAGQRSELASNAASPMFWVKVLFPAILALCALLGLRRLGYPGMRLGRLPVVTALPLVALWLIAAAVLLMAPAEERLSLLLGRTWTVCAFGIALLSIPALVLSFAAARELAPTRPYLAGASCGLFAGATAAFAYALHCPETQAPFLAVWYVLGIVIPTCAGAALGRRLLRW